MSGLFKSKGGNQSSPGLTTVYDPFASTRSALNTYLTGQIGKPGPTYSGNRVSPESDLEAKGYSLAMDAANRPSQTGELFGLAKDEARKTLSGDYDSSKSPYYQSLKAEAERNLNNTNKNIAQNAAGGGRYYGGARLKAQSDAARDVNIDLNKQLGAMDEAERIRRLQTVPVAARLDEYETKAPYQTAQTLQQIGALPREIDQSLLDALYEEWSRSNYDYPLDIAQLASGPSQQQPIWTTQSYSPKQSSSFSQLAPFLAQMAGSFFK